MSTLGDVMQSLRSDRASQRVSIHVESVEVAYATAPVDRVWARSSQVIEVASPFTAAEVAEVVAAAETKTREITERRMTTPVSDDTEGAG